MNLDAAKKAHAEFRRTMRAAGLRVLTVRDILSFGVEDHMGARVELEELAMQALQYEIAEGNTMDEIAAGVCSSNCILIICQGSLFSYKGIRFMQILLVLAWACWS